jgi:hypothetical protein
MGSSRGAPTPNDAPGCDPPGWEARGELRLRTTLPDASVPDGELEGSLPAPLDHDQCAGVGCIDAGTQNPTGPQTFGVMQSATD